MKVKGLAARLQAMLRPGAAERRMREEFAFHLEMETERLREAGRSLAEARREAMASFGGVTRYEEEMRDGRGARWFHDLLSDLRYALRVVRRSPGLALAVALTLGFGIGVNGFTYGIVDAVVVRPIPARAPEQLLGVFPLDTRTGRVENMAWLDFLDYRDTSGAFADLAAMIGTPVSLAADGSAPAMTWLEMVTENYFSLLDLTPAAGRLFGPDEARESPAAVLSYASWQRRFNGDPAVVGRVIRINGAPVTIMGVAPRGFRGMRSLSYWPELWVPATLHRTVLPGKNGLFTGRGRGWLTTFARMKDGWDSSRTLAAAAAFTKSLAREYPDTYRDRAILLVSARSGFENPLIVKPQALSLSSTLGIGASVITLLIICANLANLQMARAARRERELAIRLSLGCSRGRLIRQLVAETLVLATPGLLLSAAIVWATPWIESLLLPRLPFRVGFDLGVNGRVVLFTTAAAVLAVLLIGLLPARRAARTDVAASLPASGPAPRRGHRRVTLQNALVVTQLALSIVLLTAGMLFVRSLTNTQAADLGFVTRNRLLLSVNVGLHGYSEAAGQRFYEELQARVSARSDVAAAAWAFPVPFDTEERTVPLYVGARVVGMRDGTYRTDVSVVGDHFVQALGLKLVNGRSFERQDAADAANVMVVSRSLASRLWPGEPAVGKSLRLGNASGPRVTIVGVVADATFAALGDPRMERAYLPLRQHYRDWQTLVVDTRGDPRAILPRIREAVTSIDPALTVFSATTMEDAIDGSRSPSRIGAGAGVVFGGFALLIAAIGLYAVTASNVTARTREMGVRLALGSTPDQLTRLLIADGARLGVWGMAAGLAGALFVARTMASILFGVSAFDPITIGFVSGTLVSVVLLATYLPARRVARLDPVGVLRNE